eukprot:457471-Prymnesium_polylepis.1
MHVGCLEAGHRKLPGASGRLPLWFSLEHTTRTLSLLVLKQRSVRNSVVTKMLQRSVVQERHHTFLMTLHQRGV